MPAAKDKFLLICITGLPGSGKSFFANKLARDLGAHHLNSDRVRNRMGLRGHYDPESKKKVYNTLLEETKTDLKAGNTVILDSTFYQPEVREPFENLASDLGLEIFWIEVFADEETIRERIDKQRPYSQADFEVYQNIKKKYEAPDSVGIRLDSSRLSPNEMIEETKRELGMTTTPQIWEIIRRKAFPDTAKNPSMVETHASWVILSDHFAFKIKKPVHFSFMDFSTLEKRKYFCEEEIRLNRRLTNDIYLDVLEIRKTRKGLEINGDSGPVVNYAVKLRKMEESVRMENLLKNKEIKKEGIIKIASQLAVFHQKADVIKESWDLNQAQLDFYDLKKVRPFIQNHFGRKKTELFDRILFQSTQFLKRMSDRFVWRVENNFIRDGHGDLHSGNIFMYPEPVLFDCIEFNPHFRKLDLLDELAFLAMDLEFHGFPDLAETLITAYEKDFPLRLNEADREIFIYYKMYRANVRLKVTVLKDQENPAEEDIQSIGKYIDLLEKYWLEIRHSY
ncbi:MAG: AAA family ATPase [Bacteroidetes bacterium]|nr:AAA family ATPase [Bacteroidota bacterium]